MGVNQPTCWIHMALQLQYLHRNATTVTDTSYLPMAPSAGNLMGYRWLLVLEFLSIHLSDTVHK